MSHHLVTGGAGFIGAALTHRLVHEGHRVTVLDRFSRGKHHRLPAEARTITTDIRLPEPVEHAVASADVVWHLAYVQGTQTFTSQPAETISIALRGIMNVLDACAAHPGKDLFLFSSSEVYQNPPEGMFPTDETVPLSVPDVTNPRYCYGGGKIASELAALAYADASNRTVIVRPHNIYGPDMGWEHVIPEFAVRLMQAAQRPPAIGVLPFHIQGTGKETRSFCHITDCVDALMVLLERGEDRNVYHLGNPNEEHAIRDVAYMIADWWGEDIQVIPGELPKGSPTRRLPDISKLRALGFTPQTSLEYGLDDTLRWYATHTNGVPA